MNNKGVAAIFLIISLIIILVMGYFIYSLSIFKLEAEKEIKELKTENQLMETKLNNIQNLLNDNIISNENSEENVEKTELEEVREIADRFVKAVNEQDWETVEACSREGLGLVESLKHYNVSNMSINSNELEKHLYYEDFYFCTSDYDIDFHGFEKNDISLGQGFCLEKINGKFVVTSYGATGF